MYKLFRLFNTIKYLKCRQIYFRLFYNIRKILRQLSNFSYPLSIVSQPAQLFLRPSISFTNSLSDREFVFLNKSFIFQNRIDWNFSAYGKLWTYNLTYFEYLNQIKMQQDEGLLLINDFIEQIQAVTDGLESFPIALRGINWIKFLTKYKICDQKIDDSLYAQYKILTDNLEYHLLGNHLLENGFSLLFGAYYFKDDEFYTKAKEILISELDEQVLKDGAHFELSPMYHQIMLLRLLDSINLVQNNSWKESDLLTLLKDKASLMLGWLNAIAFDDGTIPLLNDSSCYITPTTSELNRYAEQLKVKKSSVILKECGYRKVKKDRYECIIDVGSIGPDYIPGHAHSDTFNFIMHVDGKPLIVDTGLSTYETNQRRMIERSTSAHNTVEVDGLNQSEVWGGFRVARRAKIIHLDENSHIIEATHDGYKRIGVLHTRKFTMNERSIVIEDYINSANKHQCNAYIHFHPKVRPVMKDNKIIIDQTGIIIDNAIKIETGTYQYAPEFNKLITAVSVKIAFENRLKMEIQIS